MNVRSDEPAMMANWPYDDRWLGGVTRGEDAGGGTRGGDGGGSGDKTEAYRRLGVYNFRRGRRNVVRNIAVSESRIIIRSCQGCSPVTVQLIWERADSARLTFLLFEGVRPLFCLSDLCSDFLINGLSRAIESHQGVHPFIWHMI